MSDKYFYIGIVSAAISSAMGLFPFWPGVIFFGLCSIGIFIDGLAEACKQEARNADAPEKPCA